MTARSPTMVSLHDTGLSSANDEMTVDCRHLTVVDLHDTGPRPFTLLQVED